LSFGVDLLKSRTVQESAADLGDKSCIYCGAALAGLKASDRCPGCGKLAVDSLLGDNLRDAEAPWVRTVLRGLWIMAIGYGLLIVDRLATIGQFALMQTLGPYHEAHGLFFYQRFIAFGGLLALGVGLWLVTAREESDALIARRRGLAWGLRIGFIVMAVYQLWPIIAAQVPRPIPVSVTMAVHWLGSLGALLVHGLVWLHLRRIIHRTPRRELARLLTVATAFGVPLYVLSSVPMHVHVLQNLSDTAGPWLALAIFPALQFVHHAFGAYLLLLSGKAIRRTIGDWT
jgi:hypothetical protein